MSRSTVMVALLAIGALAACNDGMADTGRKGKGARKSGLQAPRQREPRIAVTPVAADELCSTDGAMHLGDDGLRISDPAVRAVAPDSEGDAAALRFTYDGPTEQVAKLASGQERRQLGLKLRAEDGCNLVYVMWRLEPDPGLEVSIKRNPGERNHEQCGANGYVKVKPHRAVKLPALDAGTTHILQAEIIGTELIAWVDGQTVWQGRLGKKAKTLVGAAGLRTDNVALDVELLVASGEVETTTALDSDELPTLSELAAQRDGGGGGDDVEIEIEDPDAPSPAKRAAARIAECHFEYEEAPAAKKAKKRTAAVIAD